MDSQSIKTFLAKQKYNLLSCDIFIFLHVRRTHTAAVAMVSVAVLAAAADEH